MAGKRRQTQPETPERVQQAAQAMVYSASSGMQRGYVPQQTGPQQRTPQRPSQGIPQGMQMPYPNMQRQSTQPQQGMPRHAAQPQQGAPQSTGGMQSLAYTGGGTRGFVMPQATGAQPMPKNGKSGGKKTGLRLIMLIALAVVVGVGIYFLSDSHRKAEEDRDRREQVSAMQTELSRYDNLYFPGVYVDGISLGGMTPEQAKNTVQSKIQQRTDNWSVSLTYEGRTVVTYNTSRLNMTSDPDEVLNKAWEPGHFGTLEERYNAMLRLREEPWEGFTAKPSGDNSQIDRDLAEIKRQLERPPQDAAVSEFRADLEDPFIFTDEVYGMTLDTEALKTRLYHMVSTMESGSVEIQPEMIAPAVTRADLEKQYSRRSSVITPIDRHSPDNRNDNIRLAFSRISGYQLNPGKTFSFNKVVGNRSQKNGFKTAIEYVYGEHVEGVGGGVCQASTTLFQAALCAGMEIRERHAHSDSVSYTDYGKDATVSDTKGHEKDLTFKNVLDTPVYIKADVMEDPSNKKRLICKVSFYGADMEGVRYELISECTEILPPPLEPQYVKDKEAEYVKYTDQEKKVSDAKEGYVYKGYRIKYINDIAVEREELYTDTYKAKPEKIYVGVSTREE